MPVPQFINERFPDEISQGSSGGPKFKTSLVGAGSGFEDSFINWEDARGEYNVSQAVRTRANFNLLLSIFRICRGRASVFRFKDWSDFEADTMELRTNSLGQIQCAKQYLFGGFEYNRFLHLIVPGTYSGPGTVDNDTGLVSGASAGQTFSCEFDVPCRFDIDFLNPTIIGPDIFDTDVPLVEIRIKPKSQVGANFTTAWGITFIGDDLTMAWNIQ